MTLFLGAAITQFTAKACFSPISMIKDAEVDATNDINFLFLNAV